MTVLQSSVPRSKRRPQRAEKISFGTWQAHRRPQPRRSGCPTRPARRSGDPPPLIFRTSSTTTGAVETGVVAVLASAAACGVLEG